MLSVSFPNAPYSYKMEYTVSGQSLSVQLSVSGVNTTEWTKNSSGIWLGLAYNSNSMKDVVYTMCTYGYNGKVTDAFTCFDGYFDYNR